GVMPRLVAIDPSALVMNVDRTSALASRAHRGRAVQVPDPHPEAEILLGQRTHRADVDGIAGVLVVDGLAGPVIDLVVIAATKDRQLGGVRDFIEEAGTAGAQDAALLVEHHVRADIDRLALLVLLAELKARGLPIVVHVVILQLALARLVADRTIDRV